MSTEKDISFAVDIFKKYKTDFELMHCVSTYPTPIEDINLNTSKAEFSDCKWVDLNKLSSLIIPFKKKMYKEIIKEFEGKINSFS